MNNFCKELNSADGSVRVNIDVDKLVSLIDPDSLFRQLVAQYREDLRLRLLDEIGAVFHSRKNHKDHNGVGYELILTTVNEYISSDEFKRQTIAVIDKEFNAALHDKVKQMLTCRSGKLINELLTEVSKNNVTANEMSVLIKTLRELRKD